MARIRFEQYYLKKINNNMRKCSKCRQNFDDENYVIGFKLIVLKRVQNCKMIT